MGISALTQGVNASAFARFSSSTTSLTRSSLEASFSSGREARSSLRQEDQFLTEGARNALENAQRANDLARQFNQSRLEDGFSNGFRKALGRAVGFQPGNPADIAARIDQLAQGLGRQAAGVASERLSITAESLSVSLSVETIDLTVETDEGFASISVTKVEASITYTRLELTAERRSFSDPLSFSAPPVGEGGLPLSGDPFLQLDSNGLEELIGQLSRGGESEEEDDPFAAAADIIEAGLQQSFGSDNVSRLGGGNSFRLDFSSFAFESRSVAVSIEAGAGFSGDDGVQRLVDAVT